MLVGRWSEIVERSGLLTGEKSNDGRPTLTHVLRAGKDKALESCVERINTMVKELAQRTTLSRAATSTCVC